MFGDDGIVGKLDKNNAANDLLLGNGNPAVVISGAIRDAADVISGSLDLIITDALAGDGDDILSGESGADIVLGGGGDDLLAGDVDPRLSVANTVDETTETGKDVLIGDGGVVQFTERRLQRIASVVDNDPTNFRDTIYGDNGKDVIIGGQGSDSGDTNFLGGLQITRVLAGGHGPGRGETDPGVNDDDIIIADNGELLYADNTVPENYGKLELIRTTDTSNATGGADTAFGELGDDIILGGVNASIDVLNGNLGDDVVLGDNGELDFAFDGDTVLSTVDLIRSYTDGLGGTDIISGNAGTDTIIGGSGDDIMYGDDVSAAAGADDGGDIAIGDNADIFLKGTVGRLIVLGTAVQRITTTDGNESTGGADTIAGNAAADVIIGGVNDGGVDTLFGDAASQGADDGDDLMLGDNGLLHFDADWDADPTLLTPDNDQDTLDVVRSYIDGLGGTDIISGDVGGDMILGGTGGDTIHGDNAAATAGAGDGEEIVLGDNGDVFFTGASGARVVLDSAVRKIVTTDDGESTGGADLVEGNAGADIVVGGVNNAGIDRLYGDARNPLSVLDGDDVILGDNGVVDFDFEDGGLNALDTLDLIRTTTTSSATPVTTPPWAARRATAFSVTTMKPSKNPGWRICSAPIPARTSWSATRARWCARTTSSPASTPRIFSRPTAAPT
jgi:hypothetical protein